MPDFLADIQHDGITLDDIVRKLDEAGKDTPTESPAGTNQTEEAPSSQGAEQPIASPQEEKPASEANTESDTNVPFNKHPRWKQMQEERDGLRKRVDDLESSLQNVKSSIPVQQEGVEEVPTWFRMAVSEDVSIWKEYKKYSSQERAEIKRELMEEQVKERQRQDQETNRWKQYVDQSLVKVEDSFSVDLSTEQGKGLRNEFLDFMLKRKPTDDQGNVDFVNGWQWFQEVKQAPQSRVSEAKKKVAAMSDSSGSSERTGRESVSREDLRGRSWRDFI
jgi:hypothetical protein